MNVVHVSAEVAPWARTGGLGDVVGALPAALSRRGARTLTYLPCYGRVRAELHRRGARLQRGPGFSVPIAGGLTAGTAILRGQHGDTVFVEHHSFDRDGLYGDGRGTFGDNDVRFALLTLAALETAHHVLADDVGAFHAHAWHSALLPHYLGRYEAHARAKSVLTIHNLAYQGVFGPGVIGSLCLDERRFHPEGYEYKSAVSFMKAGISEADAVTTVSPRYSREILEPAFGFGLDGFLRARARRVVGVLNGLDLDVWNPRKNDAIAPFGANRLKSGKAENRARLLQEFGLPAGDDDLVVGVVSRLTAQKGLDLLADLVPQLHAIGARVVLLGSGSPQLEERFRRLAGLYSHHLAVHIGFDVQMAHRILAGSDALAIPSRFEPCGLTQMQAMRYGTLPVVHATGGLADTVQHGVSGFVFEHASAVGLGWAMHVASRFKRQDPVGYRRMQKHVMGIDWSWDQSADRYLELYARL